MWQLWLPLPDDTRIVPSAKATFSKLKKGKKATVTVTVKAAGMGALGRSSSRKGPSSRVEDPRGEERRQDEDQLQVPKTKGVHT